MVARILSAAVCGALLAIGTSAASQERSNAAMPPVVSDLVNCRAIAAATDRLACFDRATQGLQTALSSGELLVVDRAQATAARRQAFGSTEAPADILQPPRPEDRIDAIETTLVRASQADDNRWTFVLADGSTWRQTDTDRVRIVNREGEAVRVRRGALGSYLLTVGRSGVVRVRRQ